MTLDRLLGRSIRPGVVALLATYGISGCGNGLIVGPNNSSGELAGGALYSAAPEDAEVSAPTEFKCEPETVPVDSAPLRRLSNRQYSRSLQQWVESVVGDQGVASSMLDPLLASIPPDQRAVSAQDLKGSLRRLDQVVADPHVRAWFDVAQAVGRAMTAPGMLGQTFGSCATDNDAGNDARCIDDFLRKHGSRLLRAPLDDTTVEFYRGFYGDTSAPTDVRGFADVIAGLLNAPEFLYVVVHGQNPKGEEGGTHPLSAHELASRLALHFWDSLPDDALWAAAEDGSLLEDSTYRAQVDRLAKSSRAKATIREFYRDWLKLEDLPDLTANNPFPVFSAFAGENLPSQSLRGSMINEVLDSLEFHTFTEKDGVEEVLKSRYSFARDEELASIYGVDPWDGEGTPPEFDNPDRRGLLTRAALLTTGSANTRPIIKGVFIRHTLLCDEIPPPPDNVNASVPELSEDLSTREVVEGLTEVEGTACPACHKTYINPLGFATEMFDSLGRFRTEQLLFDEDGNETGSAPVDTIAAPQIDLSDKEEVDGPSGLVDKVLESGKFEACLARSYFRFSMGRWEDLDADGCALENLRKKLVDAKSMVAMLRAIALDDAFKHRTYRN